MYTVKVKVNGVWLGQTYSDGAAASAAVERCLRAGLQVISHDRRTLWQRISDERIAARDELVEVLAD